MGTDRPPRAEGGTPTDRDRLRAAGITPTRALGQHFLLNPRLLEFVIDAAGVTSGDRVLEVGPGTGALTRRLLARGAWVTAVELDRGLCRLLREEFRGAERFHLIEGDALRAGRRLNPEALARVREQDGPVKVVANLPFGSATPLVIAVLEEVRRLEVAVVTVQLEVADRFAARPGTKAYGVVSVLAQVLATVEKLKRIDRRAFWPPPKVDAACVRFVPCREERPSDAVYRALGDVVRWAFAQRRKQLGPRLAARWPFLALGGGLEPAARPEEVAPAAYVVLAGSVVEKGG